MQAPSFRAEWLTEYLVSILEVEQRAAADGDGQHGVFLLSRQNFLLGEECAHVFPFSPRFRQPSVL